MFWKDKPETVERTDVEETPAAQKTATREEVAAEIEALSLEAQTGALARRDEILAEVCADHARDAAHYKFECRRWGDFLSLLMERQVWGCDWRTDEEATLKTETYATAVNLRDTREMRLIAGNPADSEGDLAYSLHWVSLEGGHKSWATGMGLTPAPKDCRYGVEPAYPSIKRCRPMFVLDQRKEPRSGFAAHREDGYEPRLRTKGYPRPAGDDLIRFEGIGATLYVPAGLGQGVHAAILGEIASAFTARIVGEVE